MQIYKNNLIEITQNGKNVNAVVNMPFRFTAKNSTSLDSFRKDLENNLRYDVWVMLELTKTIGLALSDSDVEKEDISQQLVLLGTLGATYAETLDLLQITFNNLESNIYTTQALQFAGESLEPTTREVLAEEISAFLESSTVEENHSLLEALDELSNRTYADFPLSHIKQLFIDADSTDFLNFQSALENIKNPVVKEVLPVKSFLQQVLNFLQDENAAAEKKQTLIDYLGYEMNEAQVSVVDEGILPSSLAELAKEREGEAWGDIKQIALGIIKGYKTWDVQEAMDAYRQSTVEEENPLDLSEVEAPKDGECFDLAKDLSKVLRNPKTPAKLHEVISDEIGVLEQPNGYFTSPEYLVQVFCLHDEVSE